MTNVSFVVYLILVVTLTNQASSMSIGKCSRSDARKIQIETTSGRLVGRCDFVHVNDNNPRDVKSGNVYSWLGVPYAEPPIAENRFKAPVRVQARQEPIDASKWASSCIQFPPVEEDSTVKKFAGFAMWEPTKSTSSKLYSEDCLYLNIWTPAEGYLKLNVRQPSQPPSKLPILVFFHGGGTTRGSAAIDTLNPATFVAATNTIVITVNYRLGIYGFLYLEGYFPGNQAILDQNEALQWIHANADKFGGDVNRITLVGSNAGSILASYHLFYRNSWPLFRNAILQSGSPLSSSLQPVTRDEANRRARNVLAYAGCVNESSTTADLAKCAVNSQDLTQAAAYYFMGLNKHNQISQTFTVTAFPPVIDGQVLPDSPAHLLRHGHFKKCPILTGFNTGKFC
jgi:carboxylesterase type B